MNPKKLLEAGTHKPVKHNYVEFAEVDDIWVRAYTLEKAKSVASQHVHQHDHMTLLAHGTIKFWQDGKDNGVYTAPTVLHVPAGKQHCFEALTDNVVLCCLHNLRGTGLESPEIMKRD